MTSPRLQANCRALHTEDIFRSNKDDRNISDTSSYLDLTPLYGRNRSHQEAVRRMDRGLLKPDSFAEERLLMQPPGVCAYLIMYNRFHNYVAEQLLSINENNRFSKPAGYDGLSRDKQLAADQKQDEDLFQTARLYVIVHLSSSSPQADKFVSESPLDYTSISRSMIILGS